MYAPTNDDDMDRDALLAQMKMAPKVDPSKYSLDGLGTRQPPKIMPDPALPTTGNTAAPATPAPPPEAAAASGPYQSHHGSVSGYLQAAAKDYMPTVQGAGNEQAAKSLAEAYIRSLVPEIQKRGGTVGDIRNEKIQIDGKWVDLYRDIGGASEAQYLVEEGGPGNEPSALGGGYPMMAAAPTSATPQATPEGGGTVSSELMKRIEEILGEDVDRQALMAQMAQRRA